VSGKYNSGKWFRVRNWRQFQHYHKRSPSWIKLHYDLLASEDWVMLDDASRVLAIASMLVASRHEGHVPNNPHFMQRVAYLKRPANFKPLIECGFLENPLADVSIVQADASGVHTNARPESESEREKKESRSALDERFEAFYSTFPKRVGKKAARKAYERALRDTTPERILAAIEKQKPQWKDPQFIPHPATWLNRGQWDDEQLPFRAGGGGRPEGIL
jgi:hypothetical protein